MIRGLEAYMYGAILGDIIEVHLSLTEEIKQRNLICLAKAVDLPMILL